MDMPVLHIQGRYEDCTLLPVGLEIRFRLRLLLGSGFGFGYTAPVSVGGVWGVR